MINISVFRICLLKIFLIYSCDVPYVQQSGTIYAVFKGFYEKHLCGISLNLDQEEISFKDIPHLRLW